VLVRARNLLSVLMHCFVICCVVSLLWAAIGYSLAFAPGGALLGGTDKAFLAGLVPALPDNGLPEVLFFLFQMTVNRHQHVTPPVFRLNCLSARANMARRWESRSAPMGPHLFDTFACSLNVLMRGYMGTPADAASHMPFQ
jgi:hypothetical protein